MGHATKMFLDTFVGKWFEADENNVQLNKPIKKIHKVIAGNNVYLFCRKWFDVKIT